MSMEAQESPPRTTSAREILLFFFRFLGISIALYLLYYFVIGQYYLRFIAILAKPMLTAFGHRFIMEKAVGISEEISLNPFVFISLVAAVGHIALRRKLLGGVIGIIVLVLANALTVTFAFVSDYRQSEAWWTGTEFLDLTNNFFMPILLWLVLLPIRSAFPFFRDNGA
jgi:hypothetical protein